MSMAGMQLIGQAKEQDFNLPASLGELTQGRAAQLVHHLVMDIGCVKLWNGRAEESA